LSSDLPEDLKQENIERLKLMVFSCMYCDNPIPVSLSVVDYQSHGSGPHATGFFICPNCQNKFMVKIEDLGKVGHVWSVIRFSEQYITWNYMMFALVAAIKDRTITQIMTHDATSRIVLAKILEW